MAVRDIDLAPTRNAIRETRQTLASARRVGLVCDAGLSVSVRDIVAEIVNIAQPIRFVVFGRRATDHPEPDSDVDLMIECDHELDTRAEAVRVGSLMIAPGAALELILVTPSRVARDRDDQTSFLAEIDETGVTPYERPVASKS